MKNFIQKGDALNAIAPAGGVVSGNGYLLGSIFGIAATTVDAGVQFVLWLVGCYTLPKNSAEAWTVGQLIYWDNANACCTTSSDTGANQKIGVAVAAEVNPSASGDVRLNSSF
jgi:predicted RecA/RadA family phage recombinase